MTHSTIGFGNVLLPAAARLRRDFKACAPGLAFNAIVLRTFQLQMGHGVGRQRRPQTATFTC